MCEQPRPSPCVTAWRTGTCVASAPQASLGKICREKWGSSSRLAVADLPRRWSVDSAENVNSARVTGQARPTHPSPTGLQGIFRGFRALLRNQGNSGLRYSGLGVAKGCRDAAMYLPRRSQLGTCCSRCVSRDALRTRQGPRRSNECNDPHLSNSFMRPADVVRAQRHPGSLRHSLTLQAGTWSAMKT